MNEHPDVTKEYETLKLQLWKQYEHNRDAYTDAKTDFIRKWPAEARKEYGDKLNRLFTQTK
ncbi:MAG: GrpB family protein [Fibrobacter sp.]|nr:GrpB family protein [Fibrobacter sp.]